jgi:hypothetical protein
MKNKPIVADWLKFDLILSNGIIKLKSKNKSKSEDFVKILKINPINFNLKSDFEKTAILNSYKVFLKICDFNFQILIQSNKENISNHFQNIETFINSSGNQTLESIYSDYNNCLTSLNKSKKSSSKVFYIILRKSINNISKAKNIGENISKIEEYERKEILSMFDEEYLKIKESLSKCGNIIEEINSKEKTIEVVYSFLNTRKYINLE